MSDSQSVKGTQQKRQLGRVTVASVVGTTLEYYDHFIYGTASALVFPAVFFSQLPADVALMVSLVTYGLAYASRSIGAILFGHFGDRIGRKNMLVLALFIMGVATMLIGCLPSYATAGVWGAVGLCVLRLVQGIALGGEWGGAALMVNEFAGTSKLRAFLGSMVQMAAPIGFLLASGVFAIVNVMLQPDEFLAWGWRIPFLLSALLVLIGIYVRSTIEESPEFGESKKVAPQRESIPIADVLKNHWRPLLLAIGTRIGSDIAFYVFAIFVLVYLPFRGLEKQVALTAGIAASIGQAIGIPLFGYLSDKFSTRFVLGWGAVLNFIWAFVYFMLVDTLNPSLIIGASFIGCFLLAAMWAPLAAHMPAMFPVHVRFTGTGLGFQAAAILGGALAPTICLFLLHQYDSTLPISLYLGATLILALGCIYLTDGARRRTSPGTAISKRSHAVLRAKRQAC